MIIQVYEIQTPVEAEAMVGMDVDHIGSVISTPGQCRKDNLKATVTAVQSAGRKSSLIPLFNDMDAILDALGYLRPDIVHFCDTLKPPSFAGNPLADHLSRHRLVRQHFPEIAIMRSIPIGVPDRSASIPSLEWASVLEPVSDWFLTDTLLTEGDGVAGSGLPDHADYPDHPDYPDQPVTGFVGITGQVCDWGVARHLVEQSRIPVILAGGIGPANVAQAIKIVRPFGVDSCTLTNATDAAGQSIRFQKDPERVRALVQRARGDAA